MSPPFKPALLSMRAELRRIFPYKGVDMLRKDGVILFSSVLEAWRSVAV